MNAYPSDAAQEIARRSVARVERALQIAAAAGLSFDQAVEQIDVAHGSMLSASSWMSYVVREVSFGLAARRRNPSP